MREKKLKFSLPLWARLIKLNHKSKSLASESRGFHLIGQIFLFLLLLPLRRMDGALVGDCMSDVRGPVNSRD